ncbi:MAG: 5-formyltetrahydrofolate cyclo-ligase [Endomicrobium sp.]|nr:5-formyltetrahydrofolate cyclo-ligase [Endomicrobium sp.]
MSDYLKSEKRKVRYEFLALRNKIKMDLALNYSAVIFAKIQKLSAYNKAKTVMFYLSYGSEVITDGMVNSAVNKRKTVVVPALKTFEDEKMYAVKISRLEDASQFVYGIRQPEIIPDNIIERDNIDLIFVPGLAFDVSGYRMGYGKGCYDRWLKNLPSEKIIGLAYDFQITGKLPSEKYDIPVGIIITEKRIIRN